MLLSRTRALYSSAQIRPGLATPLVPDSDCHPDQHRASVSLSDRRRRRLQRLYDSRFSHLQRFLPSVRRLRSLRLCLRLLQDPTRLPCPSQPNAQLPFPRQEFALPDSVGPPNRVPLPYRPTQCPAGLPPPEIARPDLSPTPDSAFLSRLCQIPTQISTLDDEQLLILRFSPALLLLHTEPNPLQLHARTESSPALLLLHARLCARLSRLPPVRASPPPPPRCPRLRLPPTSRCHRICSPSAKTSRTEPNLEPELEPP